ncbi:aryl hydrocarbon receptor-like [Genypterus blacodes]|uniref:aryl hydrocarbon receptor-like n=1 Tax=Genypterus blacodes TaxID=154954 RepID=UPI003F7662AA
MLGNTALYAAKKRKKPVQKIPKPPPPDGAKSNPSKRHRDRLNGELEKLTALLPFTDEVRSRLDKLSVLRLSVGYLKVKSFFNATMKKGPNGTSWSNHRSLMFREINQNSLPLSCIAPPTSSSHLSSSEVASIDGVSFSEGDLLLQALNGFVLVVTAEGYVFYTTATIQDYLGFHESDVVHQSVFELIHTDDRAIFRRQLHFALKPNSDSRESHSEQSSPDVSSNIVAHDPQAIPPENSSFLERNFCCRFRCLLDNSSGFLALNFRGRLKFLHGQNLVSEDGTLLHPQLALFAIATPLQQPSILEIRTKTLLFQTKHKLDFTPIGIDTRGEVILGYNEIEISMKGSGYQFIHAADMMYCADNHIRMIKTGESGFTVFRLLSKGCTWVWVQANARLIFKGGKPDFIVARQRPLTNEEGEEHLRLRRLQLPFNFATGEALLYNVAPTLDTSDACSAPKQRKMDDITVSPNSLLGCMLSQDPSIYCEHNASTLNDVAFKDSHALVNVPVDHWQGGVSGPVTEGVLKGEGTIQDMVETLQQILDDSDLSISLAVEADELKSWENTLLKMSSTAPEVTEDLDELLNNDILSYVEEQLQKEFANQLDNVPDCLSTLDLLNHNDQENFAFSLQPQNQIITNGGQTVSGKQPQVLGTVKLTHMGPPQMGSSGLNGPTIQHITSQQTFAPSVGFGLLPELDTTGSLCAPVTFDPLLMDSCALSQSQMSALKATAKPHSLGPCLVPQTSGIQLHPSQLAKPMQTHLQLRAPNVSVALLDQSAESRLQPAFSPWMLSGPGSIPADTFVETYAHNISNTADFTADTPASGCLKGHFALQPQNNDNGKHLWPLEQQHQQLMSSGHQQIAACLNQTSGFQRKPLQNGLAVFRPTESFALQQEAPASRSCMFTTAPPPVPVNGLHLHQAPSCQRLTSAGKQAPTKPSCFYQSVQDGGSLAGMEVFPQVNSEVAQVSCQISPGLQPDSLLVQQQLYRNYGDQTQIKSHPMEGSPSPHHPMGINFTQRTNRKQPL